MNYTHLGRTGLKVSRLCLGTMNFGDVTDEKTSARILDEALEAGINFIDTADVYGTEQSPDIQQGSGLSEEIHNALTCSAVPIPPWERSLQTVEAQPYFNVSQASLVLEGIVFDRNNNLLFVDVATGRVFKLTPEQQLSIVLKENSFGASGLAVHKDGRIFIASVGDMQRGSVRAIEPNGTREQMIVAPDTGFLVNDLVFDNQGGFYFTDSRGNSADPQGGVFYVSPNVGSIHAILPGLAVGNGIAIDPAGSQIWATEHAKNRLHRVRLSDATTVAPFGSVVTYQFTGPAPDGARVDSEGNVYVAIFIASNYVCDRVLHWYKGNQHAPLNGVMSFFHKQTTFSYASLGPKSV